MMIDGTHFDGQQLITVLGITVHGQKLVLGLRQGATENASVVKQLLDDMRDRGVDFEVPRLYVLDGGKRKGARRGRAPRGRQRADSFNAARCTRSATSSSASARRTHWQCAAEKLHSAYAMRDYVDAERALARLLRELMDLNPSAARSLEEGMDETAHGASPARSAAVAN